MQISGVTLYEITIFLNCIGPFDMFILYKSMLKITWRWNKRKISVIDFSILKITHRLLSTLHVPLCQIKLSKCIDDIDLKFRWWKFASVILNHLTKMFNFFFSSRIFAFSI